MKASGASIRNLLVVIAVVAVDCSMAHHFLANDGYVPFQGWPPVIRLSFVGSVLMANLVVVGGSMLLPRRDARRPFLTGFVVAGALSILVIPGVALLLPWEWFIPLFRAINEQTWDMYRRYSPGMRYSAFLEACVFIVYSGIIFIPELLIATIGGLAARSLARPRPQAAPSDGMSNRAP